MGVDFIRGKVSVDSPGAPGWQEQYDFNTTDPNVAKTRFIELLNYRAAALPLGYTLRRPSLSQASVYRDSYVVTGFVAVGQLVDLITYPPYALGALETTMEGANDPNSGILYRFEDGFGRRWNRLIKGLRDSWIEPSNNFVGGEPLAVVATGRQNSFAYNAGPGASVDPALIMQDLVSAIVKNCMFSKITTVNQFPTRPYKLMTADPFVITRVLYQKVGARQTGEGYRGKKARRKQKI